MFLILTTIIIILKGGSRSESNNGGKTYISIQSVLKLLGSILRDLSTFGLLLEAFTFFHLREGYEYLLDEVFSPHSSG